MTATLIISICSLALGVLTLVGVPTIILRKYDKRQIEKTEQTKEITREVIKEELAPVKEDLEILKPGLQASLRYNLYHDGQIYLKQGWIQMDAKLNYENMYKQYERLGENGVMTDMYNKVIALPTEKPVAKKKKTTHTSTKA